MNLNDYIKINTNNNDDELIFLVDTQADISILKISTIQYFLDINRDDKIQIKGITDGHILTKGTQLITLHFNGIQIKQLFHIVEETFPIPSHGIIGKDFIQYFRCNLDYDEMNFTIKTNNHTIKIPINSGPTNNNITIPPRCEVFRIFKINNFKETTFIEQREIHPGVFIANTVAHDSTPIIRIINTNDHMALFAKTIHEHTQISNFNIYSINAPEKNKDRSNELGKIFAKNTPKEKLNTLLSLCEHYTDIFTLQTDKMTTNNFYTQKIRTTDDSPVYTKNYRIPHGQKEEVDKQVNKLIENDLVEPSVSPYNSPIILVPKKSSGQQKKWRLCIDYRKVNKKLIQDKYPLPRMDVILDGLGRAKYFSTLDLFSGFHQIPIEKESREITAFTTERGIFQWKVLPFGLNIAPNSFSTNP